MTAYIGVTAHWISEDWELRSAVLSFQELPGSHSGENMAAHLLEVVKGSMGVEKARLTLLDLTSCRSTNSVP
jgi:hypothetical protein